MGKVKKGFTLVGILVAVSLMGIVIGTSAQLFFYVIRSNRKARAILTVKQTGDNALTAMTYKIRNAEEITSPICDLIPSPSSSISIINEDDTITNIICSSGGINLDDGNLIGEDIIITNHDACFTCYSHEAGMPEIIEINFTLNKAGGDVLEDSELDFSTTVSLRNY